MTSTSLSTDDRLRRVILLCCHFARNVAYYKAAVANRRANRPQDQFWVTIDVNFIDTAVLEWCKLFGDAEARQGWRKVIDFADRPSFEVKLLAHLGLRDAAAFEDYIETFTIYRNKFVAHLDSEKEMVPPLLDTAVRAADFLHRHAWAKLAVGRRGSLPADLPAYFDLCFADGMAAYHGIP